eukprot:463638-Hanusia_phi.AAC.1
MQPAGGWGGSGPHLKFHDMQLCSQHPSFYCVSSRACKYSNTPTVFDKVHRCLAVRPTYMPQRWFLTFLGATAYVDPGERQELLA